MPIRTNKFAPPVLPRRGSLSGIGTVSLRPIYGFNVSRPPQSLGPGETPYATNLIIEGERLRPRSGLSQYGTLPSAMTRITLAAKSKDLAGTTWELVLSDNTAGAASVRTTGSTNWVSDNTNLSSLIGSTSTTSYYDWESFYDPSQDQNVIVATKGDGVPLYRVLDNGSFWTHMSDFNSVESSAHFVASFDNRLLFFNTSDSRNTIPFDRRVRWSVRGLPSNFTGDGAGFEDLLDMDGTGTGLHVQEDRIVLFSTKEVWTGRPRRDAYAFDFAPLDKTIGNPYPRTAAVTPVGVIWLGTDHRFYRASSNVVRPFFPKTQEYLRDHIRDSNEAWSEYDKNTNTFKFYFSDTTGEGASKAFYLNLGTLRQHPQFTLMDDGAWMLQDFNNHQIGCGFEGLLGGSKGTIFNESSVQTTDAGSALSWTWRSNGLRSTRDPNTYEGISELYFEYETDSNTSVDIYTSPDLGSTFNLSGTASWTTSTDKVTRVPLTPIAARHAQFELRGPIVNQFRLAEMTAYIRSYTGRYSA